MSSFKRHLQKRGIIPKTIERHQREVKRYKAWLGRLGKTPETATKKDLINYLQYLLDSRKLATVTQNQMLIILRNYHRYLEAEHGINDITRFVKIRGTKRRHLYPVFSLEQLDELCEAFYYHAKEYTPTAKELRFYQDYENITRGQYLALTLIAYQALQAGEIVKLTSDSFDLRRATVKVEPGLRGNPRILKLDPCQIAELITHFEQNRDKWIIPNKNHIEHLSNRLKGLYPKYQNLRQVRASRIIQWIKIYGLRKSQHMAGHKTISTTQKYMYGEFETILNDMENFHPLN